MSGQDWQPELWRELVARTGALSSGYHRANLYEEFIHELQRTAALPGKLPQRVFVFGISALPPRYVEALLALGSRPEVEVHLFVTNPCRYYWGDLLDRKTWRGWRTSSNPAPISRPCRAPPTRCLPPWASWGATTCIS